MNDFTGSLYARPSFTEGVARIVDFGNTLNEYNISETPEEADASAFASDWRALGSDMKRGILYFARPRRAIRHAKKQAPQSSRSKAN